MSARFPPIEPHAHGMLDVGAGQQVYWEVCGAPEGKPALVLHGGPGSGCTPQHRRLFDPRLYRIVLFDQRGCGRSTPHASTTGVDLSPNTTWHLVADIERLRRHLDVDRWLVLGGSWGSTLALAYAERHLDRVSELVLFGVTTGRRKEFDWWFRGGAAVLLPEQWERLRAALPGRDRDRDVVEAYHDLLLDPDPVVRARAAEAWCRWESAAPAWPPAPRLAPRFADPAFALAFARLVTHYVRHGAWVKDEALLTGAYALANVPGVLVNGLLDLQSPVAWAWDLHAIWRGSDLVVVDDGGHSFESPGLTREIVRATNRFAGA